MLYNKLTPRLTNLVSVGADRSDSAQPHSHVITGNDASMRSSNSNSNSNSNISSNISSSSCSSSGSTHQKSRGREINLAVGESANIRAQREDLKSSSIVQANNNSEGEGEGDTDKSKISRAQGVDSEMESNYDSHNDTNLLDSTSGPDRRTEGMARIQATKII